MWRWIGGLVMGVLIGAGVTLLASRNSTPTNFDECVLAEMRGRTNDMLQFATSACRQKFPPPGMFDDLIPQ